MLPTRARVVIISGASRGIGRATARRLYDDGYRLSLGMRQTPVAAEAARGMDADRLRVAPYEAREAKNAQDWVAARSPAATPRGARERPAARHRSRSMWRAARQSRCMT